MKHLKTIVVAGLLAATVLPAAAIDISGAGATFPYPIYAKWADAYKKETGVGLNYQSIGSGGGIKQIQARTVTFGASDAPLKGPDLDKGGLIQFPMVMGAIVPVVNLEGIKAGGLVLDGPTLAGIFLGKIAKWNDPEITKVNPGVNLPSNDIVVVHRSDGSGTTYVWTDYLSKISDEWKSKVNRSTSVNWPVGLGGKGNEGVTGLVKQTPNSIGYVELIYAVQNNIPYGSVKNPAGTFVKADLASVSAAATGAAKEMPEDFRVSITNALGKTAYPISSFTWLLIPSKIQDSGKRDAIKGFLGWMLNEGQGYAEQLSYAKLPKEVVEKEKKAIGKVQ